MATSNYSPLKDESSFPEDDFSQSVPAPSIATGEAEPPGCQPVDVVRSKAREAVRAWKCRSTREHLPGLTAQWKRANRSIRSACKALQQMSPGARWLIDESSLLLQALQESHAALQPAQPLVQIMVPGPRRVPRVYAAAESYLRAVQHRVDENSLLAYMKAVQEDAFFSEAELHMLRPFLQMVLLEQIGTYAETVMATHEASYRVSGRFARDLLRCLRALNGINWKRVLEALSETDRILRQDPAGMYTQMDVESREEYRRAVVELAAHSPLNEPDVAREAIRFSNGPHEVAGIRARERRLHVGYFLVDTGREVLKTAIEYDAPVTEHAADLIRIWPTFFYLGSITLITAAILGALTVGLGLTAWNLRSILVIAILLIPVMECSTAIANALVAYLVRPRRLPRLDFSGGIPDECTTLVAVPMLLVSDKQVRQAVKDLEIRYLANRDRNLHFALVTDPADSSKPFDERDSLAELCSALVRELNDKYASRGAGSFVHLHRHRTYNESEGIWMGWERKRGKVLDLNSLLLNEADRFPVKAGNVAVLRNIRYVITLDQDTQLPPDSARELVGALAHPLNRAVLNWTSDRILEGYTILQPRVVISVKATTRSRLAAICSGDNGFDTYTRAISDVYQDLFGAGIYTGKGIYEVETFQRLLEHRFPCNVILSHDLIEGAHSRAGLISDVELIEEFPSHISAYSRRKHRWVRGDWQIVSWLLPRVPDSAGQLVPNPLNLISRWQIVDNLRRSLNEISTFVLLLCGWLLWPNHALLWTLVTLTLIATPIYLSFVASLFRAGRGVLSPSFWRGARSELSSKHAFLLFRVLLLCYQSLVALDAVIRTIVRMTVTRRKLLEWETSAQSEHEGGKGNSVERYLIWTAVAAMVVTGLISGSHPFVLPVALPFLMIWGASQAVCDWLARPQPTRRKQLGPGDQVQLREMALRTWRFFREFCTEEDNWLIPDVVQVNPPIVVHAASTTNLGLLLNAQWAAHDLGFLAPAEVVSIVEKTVGSIEKLPTLDGHFYNWYDTHTLAPHGPRFISTVDNGNLACGLWTLKGACVEMRSERLFRNALWHGLAAHLSLVEELLAKTAEQGAAANEIGLLRDRLASLPPSAQARWTSVFDISEKLLAAERMLRAAPSNDEIAWWAMELSARGRNMEWLVRDFAPWLSPEFAVLVETGILGGLKVPAVEALTLETMPVRFEELHLQLQTLLRGPEISEELRPVVGCLCGALTRSSALAQNFLGRLQQLERVLDRLVHREDFSSLYRPQKKLLSTGFDVESKRLWESHYDLLASEARTAIFVAIAKGDIPHEAWFETGRTSAIVNGRSVMLSWTGTMFEYLMPTLWMKLYPGSLLEHAARKAVLVQQEYVKGKSIPWGISECSFAEHCPNGRFGYRAFGVPSLALSRLDPEDLVISPYSTFLALMMDPVAAMDNLRDMRSRGWLGAYGFYEACDFTPSRLTSRGEGSLVTCWMAHHQGMSLVAVANVLANSSMQRRFHAEPMVAATERILQEVPRNSVVLALEERNEFGWQTRTVPVLRNLWQTAFSSREHLELRATPRVHNTD